MKQENSFSKNTEKLLTKKCDQAPFDLVLEKGEKTIFNSEHYSNMSKSRLSRKGRNHKSFKSRSEIGEKTSKSPSAVGKARDKFEINYRRRLNKFYPQVNNRKKVRNQSQSFHKEIVNNKRNKIRSNNTSCDKDNYMYEIPLGSKEESKSPKHDALNSTIMYPSKVPNVKIPNTVIMEQKNSQGIFEEK